ncbi:MAG: glycosyl hydrolase, partial [Bacteroidetes bacterium]|nr:glycosyl hydrolase [Bacteroidota bacterium]
KNKSTTIYGNIVALDESPKKEGLLYVGTDDGLIQVSEDMGRNWTKVEKFKDVPEQTYVNMIVASQHDENVVYAVFNNHKNGDFKPYVLKSTNKGKNWTNITGDLPERGSSYAIAEDHKDPNLLFVGTEFGVFFTNLGGSKWVQLKGGLPTIAVRDIAIQKREDDLVLGTFGRGFYVLDNYDPLRTITEENMAKDFVIFPVKEALMYIESNDLGRGRKGFQGDALYSADNPPVGAVITYYLKDDLITLKEERKKAEKDSDDDIYPDYRALKAEDLEQEPFLIFTIADEKGNVIRKIKASGKKGLHRIVWDFKYDAMGAANLNNSESGRWALPGTYSVSAVKFESGKQKSLRGNQTFNCKPINENTLSATDKAAVKEFTDKVAKLRLAIDGSNKYMNDLDGKIKLMKQAVLTSQVDNEMYLRLVDLEERIADIDYKLNGDKTLSSREFESLPSVSSRLMTVVWYLYNTTAAPTKTFEMNYEMAYTETKSIIKQLEQIAIQIEAAEKKLSDENAPWTPGRLPKLD